MDDQEKDPILADRAERFCDFLTWAKKRGMSQTEVADRLGVPRQYVTNVKMGDRILTELLARRIAQEFNLDFRWFLDGAGTMVRPAMDPPGETDSIVLPLLAKLISGEPRRSPTWDGAVVTITGPALYAVGDSVHSYVYRVGDDDSSGRLKQGDLVLICQGDPENSPSKLVLLELGDRPTLAWSTDDGRWKSTRTGRAVSAESKIIGHCLGIIWARF